MTAVCRGPVTSDVRTRHSNDTGDSAMRGGRTACEAAGVAAFADDHGPAVVLETGGDDLARAGTLAVDQHHHREPGLARPLEDVRTAMAAHGLLIERMEEPMPPEGFLARAPEYRHAATIPRWRRIRRSRRDFLTPAGTSSATAKARVPSSCEYVKTPT